MPKTLVIDNLRAGVSQADWYDPTINPKFEAFCRHYGVVVLPAKPYTPRHKGKVEAGVKYAQENAVKAREFASLSEQNSHLTDWERTVADLRIHGTTRRQVRQLFIEQERPKLLPLPADRFPCFQEAERTVHRDGHIEVAKSFYSVPPEFLGRKVWVRWDSRLVTILDQHHHRTIASHVRVDPGRFQTSRQHIPAEKISGVEKGAEHLLERARRIGPESARWAEAVVKARGFAGLRVLPGFLLLGAQYPWRRVEGACTLALSHGEFRLRTLRRLLDREDPDAQEIDFLEAHPIIRNPMEYAPLVGDAFQSA